MKTTENTHEPQKCKWCGKEFIPKARTNVFCSRECSRKNHDEEERNSRKRRKKKTNTKKNIDITKEAKAHGMTYGKYVAYLEMQRVKEEK